MPQERKKKAKGKIHLCHKHLSGTCDVPVISLSAGKMAVKMEGPQSSLWVRTVE